MNSKNLKNFLPPDIPSELIDSISKEYLEMKTAYLLGNWRPNELSGGRFAEGIIRVLHVLNGDIPTPMGTQLNTTKSLNTLKDSPNLTQSLRTFVTSLCRILLDIRNRRDVAHIGGEVSPNESDSKFVISCADWILAELVRHHYSCTLQEASNLVREIVEFQIPVIAYVDDFPRIQNINLTTKEKILILLTSRDTDSASDKELAKWTEYKNFSAFKEILRSLHKEALVHYSDSKVTLLPKGAIKVAKEATRLLTF